MDIALLGLPSDVFDDEEVACDEVACDLTQAAVDIDLPSDIGRKTFRIAKRFDRGSVAHVSAMNRGRKARQENDRHTSDNKQMHALKRGWDAMMLRQGDLASASASSSSRNPHCNQYTPNGLLQVTWKDAQGMSARAYHYAGKSGGQRQRVRDLDVRDSSKALQVSNTVAALSFSNQASQMAKFSENGFANAKAIRIRRGADSTPWALQFGELTSQLRETARYFVRKTITLLDGTLEQRFVTVDYAEYCKAYPKFRNTTYGVLEVCAAWVDVSVMNDDAAGWQDRTLHIVPMVLEKGNSSCLQSM